MKFIMPAWLQLLRPKQWIKNSFLFLPMFFGGELFSIRCWINSLCGAFIFALASSAIYAFNDARDVEADRNHPKKCKRPVASGKISTKTAFLISALLALTAVILSTITPISLHTPNFTPDHSEIIRLRIGAIIIISGYIFINIAYSLGLKNISILDVMIVSVGFVLRLAMGGIVCNIILSPWIIVMVFLLALFLAFAKRRDDLVIARSSGISPRSSSADYNIPFLNQTLAILAAVLMIGYIMYALSPVTTSRLSSDYIYTTSIFVLAALLRYLQITIVNEQSGSPTDIILNDRFMQICVILWALTFALMIY